MKELLRRLSDARGISGREESVTDLLKRELEGCVDEMYTDALGSLIAVKHSSNPNAPKVMLEAHTDEVGLMVKDIDERGFIGMVSVGGIDPRILPAAEVTVHAKRDITGVIGAKPPHLTAGDEEEKAARICDMAVDTGLCADEVRELVTVGDVITLAQSAGELADGQISLKTMDDRAGAAVLVSVMKSLEKTRLDAELYAVFAVQEEVGCRGAKTAAWSIAPALAVAVDVCHAITPDNSDNAFRAGSGTVISKGPNIHPAVAKRLFDTAKRYNIDYSTDVDGGDTGTDAWVIQVSGVGVATGLLSVPLKYMHTGVETLALSDVTATADLLERFVRGLDTEVETWLTC